MHLTWCCASWIGWFWFDNSRQVESLPEQARCVKITLSQMFTATGYYSLIVIHHSSFLIPNHYKLHIADSRLGLHVRDVGAGGEVSGKCTLIDKIFQNPSRFTWGRGMYSLAFFLQFAIFITKTTSFISKNVIFIILIFSELNILHAWFVCFNFVILQARIFKIKKWRKTKLNL